MIPILRELVAPYGGAEVVEGDILNVLRSGETMRKVLEPQGSNMDAMRSAGAMSIRSKETTPWLRGGETGVTLSPQETVEPRGRQVDRTVADDGEGAPQGGPSPKGRAPRATSSARSRGSSTTRDVRGLRLKIAANLPYGITSEFLSLLFDAVATGSLPPPERAVLLLQREVVDRLCANAGFMGSTSAASDEVMSGASKRSLGREWAHGRVGLLTIVTQLHCHPRLVARVPASHFWPPPRVESAVVALNDWRSPDEIAALVGDRDAFLATVRAGFAHPRRQLAVNLTARRPPSFDGARQSRATSNRMTRETVQRALEAAHIPPRARPADPTLDQWITVHRALG